jgi:two-component system, cell cycle response regulator
LPWQDEISFSMRVVLVDPSQTVLKLVRRLLEARKDEVRTFTDGRKALEYIKSDPDVGVVITSTEPLSISGLELCWEVRLLASTRRPIFVILMSATSDRSRMIEALDAGADDFIGKPPEVETLYARLRAAERLAAMQRELIRLATIDSLTGVFNRRAFFEKAKEMCARAAGGIPLAAIMLDIDHFKQINDRYGHGVGDEAISIVAREAMVESSAVGRLGGEEFAVLLEGRQLAEATATAEALRLRLAHLKLETGSGAVSFTCSLGVGQWKTDDTIDGLLKRADIALYRAKTDGRNRVVVADDADNVPATEEGEAPKYHSTVVRKAS